MALAPPPAVKNTMMPPAANPLGGFPPAAMPPVHIAQSHPRIPPAGNAAGLPPGLIGGGLGGLPAPGPLHSLHATVAPTHPSSHNGSHPNSHHSSHHPSGRADEGDDLVDELTCPITLKAFLDPVSTIDGQTYEREAIEAWLRTHNTSPLTGEVLLSKALIPNVALRQIMRRQVIAASESTATAAAERAATERAAVERAAAAEKTAMDQVTIEQLLKRAAAEQAAAEQAAAEKAAAAVEEAERALAAKKAAAERAAIKRAEREVAAVRKREKTDADADRLAAELAGQELLEASGSVPVRRSVPLGLSKPLGIPRARKGSANGSEARLPTSNHYDISDGASSDAGSTSTSSSQQPVRAATRGRHATSSTGAGPRATHRGDDDADASVTPSFAAAAAGRAQGGRSTRTESAAPASGANGGAADELSRPLNAPWAEDVEGGASRLCIMVRDEATGHIIGLGGCRIRQIASELWPTVNQLSIASREKGARSRQPRQLSIGGNRTGILAALGMLNELLPPMDHLPQSAFTLAETLSDAPVPVP